MAPQLSPRHLSRPASRRFAAGAAALLLIALTVLAAVPRARQALAARPGRSGATADLRLTAAELGPVAPGAAIRLTWTVRNQGGGEADEARIDVSWPAGVRWRSGSPAAQAGPQAASWELGAMAAGAERVLTATLDTDVLMPAPGQIEVLGQASSADDGDPPDDNAVVLEVLVRGSDLRARVDGPPRPVGPGELITHTVQLFNVGQGSAEDLVLGLAPGAGLTWRRDTAEAVEAGLRRELTPDGVVYRRDRAPGPWSGSFTVVTRVPVTATRGTFLRAPLVLTLSGRTADLDPDNNRAVAADLEVQQPDLALEVGAPAELAPDAAAEYVLEYGNHGTGLAVGVVVTGTLPAGVGLISAQPPALRVGDRALVWERSDLPVGESDRMLVQLRLDGHIPAGQRVRFEAEVASAVVDIDRADNHAFGESLVLPAAAASVVLSPARGQVPVDGGQTDVTALVTDAFGNAVSDGTVVSFTSPAGLLEPGAALTLAGRATASFRAGALPGPARIVAQAGAARGEVVVQQVPASLALEGRLVPMPPRAEVQPGDTMTYVLTARNRGQAAAAEPVLVVNLESRLAPVAALVDGAVIPSLAQVPPGILDAPPDGYQQHAWRLADLPADASREIAIAVHIDADPPRAWTGFDPVFFRAGIASRTADANPADQVHQERADILASDLYSGVELRGTLSSIRPGGLLVYEITAGNAAQANVAAGGLTVTLPISTTFDHWEQTHGTPLQLDATTTQPGSTALAWAYGQTLERTSGLKLWLNVDPQAPPEQLLQAQVEVWAPNVDIDPFNNVAQDVGAWLTGVNLSLAADGPAQVQPGAELAWRLDLRNLAQRDNARNVVVRAVPPAGFTVVSHEPGAQALPDGSLRWVVDGMLGPGAAQTFSLRAKAPTDRPAGTRHTLRAEVVSSDRDSFSGDNKASAEVVIAPGPLTRLSLTAERAELSACAADRLPLRAQLEDAFGNPVPTGAVLAWQASAGRLAESVTISAMGVATNSLLAPDKVQSVLVSVQSADQVARLTVPVLAGPPRKLGLLARPATVLRGGQSMLEARLWDDCGNPARDGSQVAFQAARGQFLGGDAGFSRGTLAGLAEARLDVGLDPGPLRVEARHGEVVAMTELDVSAATPSPTPRPRWVIHFPRIVRSH